MNNLLKKAFTAETWNDLPIYKQSQCHWDPTIVNQIPYLQLTLAFGLITFLFEFYLDWRQLTAYNRKQSVPKEIHGLVEESVFQKSLVYGKEKLSFGIVRSTFGFFEGVLLIMIGYQPWAWDISQQFALKWIVSSSSSLLLQEMVVSAVFFAVLTIQSTITSLPFSYYSTFVIEEKHGFNKMDVSTFVKDTLLSLGLGLGLGSPILALVVWVIRMGGPQFYFYVWAVLFVISLLFTSLYPVLIAPLFNKYTQLEDSPLLDAITALAKRVDFPLTKIFTVDGSKRSAHSNAYFYGFFKNKRIVIYDTLINQVTQDELLAILGHEIGHWRLWHTLQNFVITQVVVFAIFCIFSFVQSNAALFESFGFCYPTGEQARLLAAGLPAGSSPMPVFIGLMIFAQSMWAPIDKVLTLTMTVNSRSNEFAADMYADKLGMGPALQSGLVKIHTENLGNLVPDPWYSMYHFSHPSLVERLRALGNSTTGTAPTKAKKQK